MPGSNDIDPYEVLGLSPKADDVVIRAAWKALIRKYHPDASTAPDAAERAARINAAFKLLVTAEARRTYDRRRAQPATATQRPAPAPADTLAALGQRLHGRTTLILGPSGAGKSTLINRLIPGAAAQTGEISQALNSGKHTTTTTTWYWLDEARASALIDSPGFQEFGLHHIDPMQLAAHLPGIRPHVAECRFYNCTHLHEPGCGVTAQVQSSAGADGISASRYRIYSELFAELRDSR